ncbi:hypothetical protein LXA43DRAFT_244053 [Ganoderma leucocontextum]|nr:hypothetical protein LXA43DRAFT_244053 [Ganoderma leucocontextum]
MTSSQTHSTLEVRVAGTSNDDSVVIISHIPRTLRACTPRTRCPQDSTPSRTPPDSGGQNWGSQTFIRKVEYQGYKKLDRSAQEDLDKLLQAAEKIKTLYDQLHLLLLVVHLFSRVDGYQDAEKLTSAVARAGSTY